jgi:hypothetical protein
VAPATDPQPRANYSASRDRESSLVYEQSEQPVMTCQERKIIARSGAAAEERTIYLALLIASLKHQGREPRLWPQRQDTHPIAA